MLEQSYRLVSAARSPGRRKCKDASVRPELLREDAVDLLSTERLLHDRIRETFKLSLNGQVEQTAGHEHDPRCTARAHHVCVVTPPTIPAAEIRQARRYTIHRVPPACHGLLERLYALPTVGNRQTSRRTRRLVRAITRVAEEQLRVSCRKCWRRVCANLHEYFRLGRPEICQRWSQTGIRS